MRFRRPIVAVAVGTALVADTAWLVFVQNDNARRTKASYTKYEYRVAMRDGTTLFTQVYVPKA